MRKLFVLPEEGNPYAEEIACARERVNGTTTQIHLDDLCVEYVKENGIEVVISAGLPPQWYYALRGMDVVTITLGERERYYELSDIVIDCRNEDPKRYFVSREHSVCNNRDFGFDYIADLVRKLEWDSNFFGFNVAFLSCMHLTETIWRRIEKFVRRENIRLVEYLCNCHDARSVRVAEDKGFRFTDIRLRFSRKLTGAEGMALPDGITFDTASEEHIPALREIASGLYEDSRYLFDSNFDVERIDEFYQNWVQKGVRGQFDDECWCLFEGGKPFAFCTVRYLEERAAHIGLVGIANSHWGDGHGKRLLHSVFNKLYERDVRTLGVITQGRNYAAQNLYQSTGFRIKATQLWYHKWI